MTAIRLDHLVVGAMELEAGRLWVEERLGVPSGGGGRHARMGTHNALWGLGDCYLEVIAVDPEGRAPDRPRWFGLDDPDIRALLEAGPRLLTWAVAVDDLDALDPPVPCDPPVAFARDDLTWQVMLPEGRGLPLGGAWPLTIRWTSGLHPAKRLGDQGLRLERLEIGGAGSVEAEEALGAVEGPVAFTGAGGPTRIAATIRTPEGVASL